MRRLSKAELILETRSTLAWLQKVVDAVDQWDNERVQTQVAHSAAHLKEMLQTNLPWDTQLEGELLTAAAEVKAQALMKDREGLGQAIQRCQRAVEEYRQAGQGLA